MKPKMAAWPTFFLLVACAHTGPELHKGEWYGDLHALATEAAAARGMTLTQQFEVIALPDASFLEAFAKANSKQNQAQMSELANLTGKLAFVTIKNDEVERQLKAQAKAVSAEQVTAFYDFETHRLYVREALPTALVGINERMRVLGLAHEVGHVLQDQKKLAWGNGATFEEAIALKAVLEGDASLTAALVDAARQNISGQRIVERMRLGFASLSRDQVIEMTGSSPRLMAANEMLRDIFTFPNWSGQRFITDIYAAGGLPLVDAVLKRGPTRTADVLNAQRWLDGGDERVHPFAPSALRFGVLLFRASLASCIQASAITLQDGDVAWAEQHLTDDSFVRIGGSLVWASRWDTGETAIPTRLMTQMGICFGADKSAIEVVHQNHVSILSVRTRNDLQQSLAINVRPAEQPPHGHQVVPPLRPALAWRTIAKGERRGAHWQNTQLGVAFEGLETDTFVDEERMALLVTNGKASMSASFIDEPYSDFAASSFVNAALGGALRQQGGYSLGTKHTWEERSFGELQARVAMVKVNDKVIASAVAVPLCSGHSVLYVVAIARETSAVPTVERWVSSWHWAGAASICSERESASEITGAAKPSP